MKVSLAPARLARYKDILLLLARHGRGRLVREATLEDVFKDGLPDAPAGEAERLAEELEELGPTFVKLGQLLSTRPDFLPPAYLEALSRLQDRLEPFPFDQVEEIVEAELGVRLSKAFASFEKEPIAAASLGQVHRAELRDGRPVAVKVQRPDVRERVREDLAVLEEVAGLLDRHPPGGRDAGYAELVEEFRRTIVSELDYRSEAAHLRRLGEILSGFDRLVVPAPVDDYTSSRVLTMDYIRGRKVTTLSPLVRLELDGEAMVEELFEAYLRQVLVHGFFHADPHPGNVFLTEDRRLALIDLGMVATVGDDLQERLLHLLLAVADGRGGDAADAALDIATDAPGRQPERDAFREEVDRLVRSAQEAAGGEYQVGRLVLEVGRLCGDHGLRLPTSFAMLGRTLMALDEIGRTLAPDFDPNAAVRRHAAELMQRRMWKAISPGNLASAVLEMGELVRRMPGRLNRVLETIADNRLSLRVDAIDERRLLQGFQKIANRITAGLVIAALLVSAALLMRVDAGPYLFGYPAFATLLFIAAVVCGFALLWSIARSDVGGPEDED